MKRSVDRLHSCIQCLTLIISTSHYEILSGLSEGETIQKIILDHQERNGRFYYLDKITGFYKNIPGVAIIENEPNLWKLRKDSLAKTFSRSAPAIPLKDVSSEDGAGIKRSASPVSQLEEGLVIQIKSSGRKRLKAALSESPVFGAALTT